LFTSEQHDGAYLQLFYVALGHVSRLTRVPLAGMYQIARVLFALIMLLLIYRFMAYFTDEVTLRRRAFLFATMASGLGWLTEAVTPTPPGGVSPIDFWLMDGYTYLALLTSPHFCAAIALLLSIFLLLFAQTQRPTVRRAAWTVLASTALALIHPHMLIVADVVPVVCCVMHWVISGRLLWRGLPTVAAMGLTQAPIVAYDLEVFRARPVFAGWAAQNVTMSPPVLAYLLGYAPLLILAFVSGLQWSTSDGAVRFFPLIWIGLVATLIHIPWKAQRRFLEGVQVPMGLLAAGGLTHLSNTLFTRPRMRWLCEATAIALASMSNLYIVAGLVMAIASHAPGFFQSAHYLTAVDWLAAKSSWQETVLASVDTGAMIPARIGHRVVIGHGMETIDFGVKDKEVARFFSSTASNAYRRTRVRAWNVRWLVYGPKERAQGDFNPDSARWLREACRSGSVKVYEVTSGAGSGNQ
jgi:hypothetical protein